MQEIKCLKLQIFQVKDPKLLLIAVVSRLPGMVELDCIIERRS